MKDVLYQEYVESQFAPDSIINGRYRLVKELGRGGMGVVYLVEDTARDNEIIVLKIFQSDSANHEEIESLRKEFSILAAIRHTNLVRVFDFGKIAGQQQYFFTMEFVEGTEFFSAVKNQPFQVVISLFVQLIQALDYIHATGIFHGDIKSENILVYKNSLGEYHIKLMDFGLAVKENEAMHANAGGTLEYLAPELFQNASVSILTDLYAIGVLMYWTFSGKAPFAGSPDEIKTGHQKRIPQKLTTINASVPVEIENLVARLLSKDPLERYSTCEELLTAIGVKSINSLKTSDIVTPLIWDAYLRLRSNDINQIFEYVQSIISADELENRSNFISLKGSEGSGHNRIIDEIKYRLQIQDVNVLESWCRDDKSSSYQAFLDLFKGFSEIENFILNSSYTLSAIRAGKEDFELQRLKYMEDLSIKIKNRCRKSPIIIILRNIELANEGTLELLYYLGRTLSSEKLAFIVSITTDKLSEDISLTIQKGRDSLKSVFDYRVKRLEQNDIDLLLKSAFKNNLFPQKFTRNLFEKCGGNPEIITAIMTAMNRSGYFSRSDKTWMISEKYDFSNLDLRDINDLYIETFNGLSDFQKNILKFAAVFEFSIEKNIFAQLLEYSLEKFEHELAILHDKRILIANYNHEFMYFYFASSVFRDVIYGYTTEEERAKIYQRIIIIYKNNPGIEVTLEQRAYHYLNAGLLKQGMYLASSAFKLLKNSHANRRALMIATLARDKCDCYQKRFYRLFTRYIADIHDILGDTDKALELYNELGGMYKTGITRSAVLRRLSSLYQKVGDLDKASDCLNESLRQTLNKSVIERALILRELSWIHIMQGQFDKAIELGKDALNILPDNSPTRTLALTLNNLGGASFYAGNIEQAVEYFSRSAKVKSDLGDQRSMAATLNNLGIVHNVSGNPDMAKSYWQKSLEILEQIGDLAGLSETLNNLGILQMESGQFERALNYFKKSKDLKNRIGDIKGLVALHCNMGELLFLREDFSLALETLDEGIKFAERIKSLSDKAEMLYQKARVFIALNQLQAAELAIDGCLAFSESLKDKSKLGIYFSLKARVVFLITGVFENEFMLKAEEMHKIEKNHTLHLILSLEKLSYYTRTHDIENSLTLFHDVKTIVETSNYRWYELQLLILYVQTMILEKKPAPVIERALNKAEELANSMNLLLQIKNIYLLKGLVKKNSGDLVNSYKSFRRAYQCLKLCVTHISQEEYKQSIISLPENMELLKSIKEIKSLIAK